MAPEHEARMRVLYDHERDEPGRRRRAVADWGVGEDIFDRMPSRRFKRADRRAEHHVEEGRRFERRDDAPRRAVESWADEVGEARGAAWADDADERGESAAPGRRKHRPVESWFDAADRRTIVIERSGPVELVPAGEDELGPYGELAAPEDVAGTSSRQASYGVELESAPMAATAPEPSFADRPSGRRTVVISGHPDRVPIARVQRPPRTALERVGTSPDRIVAYAVALGFLLVLIAVLTTGQ
ncbi:MAG TPA: hypothetical protein VFG79_14855 [Solirubrobacter sp.]|nr:hypothetical protein [Solirubrobacter sp.]